MIIHLKKLGFDNHEWLKINLRLVLFKNTRSNNKNIKQKIEIMRNFV